MEAVFRPEICWTFSGGFWSISWAFRQELVGNHRKKSEKFPVGILLPRSGDFRCFPAGTGPYFSTWEYAEFYYHPLQPEKRAFGSFSLFFNASS
jgi:hypothetical protein